MARPNIVFVLIDDLGWRDLGCYGSTFYETPNLDRLAREGMRFTNAYASCPVCSPTRASILTGKYPARVGVTQFIGGRAEGLLKDVPYLHYLPLEETSLATALRNQGYQTWHVGKWHLGDEDFYPERHGFDVNRAGCSWGHPPTYFSPYGNPRLEDGPPGEYLTDRLTNEAIALIRHRGEKPFYLNFWHYAVHTPIQAPKDLIEKYRRKAAMLKIDQVPAFLEGEYFPVAHKAQKKVTRRLLQSDPAYAAMIENLDTNIGRLLQTLQDEGIAENTIVVFTSDNGGLSTAEGAPTCNLPLAEGKGWMYEGGNRVCQLMRWPKGIPAGTQCHVPVTSTDYYATFLEACGAPSMPAQHCDGVSLMPLFRGERSLPREAIFWHYPHYSNQGDTPASAMLSADGRWKLIEYFEDSSIELYDLVNDLSETRDLSEAQPERAREMLAVLKAWQRSVLAKIPEFNPGYPGPRRVPRIPNNAHV